MTPCSNSQAGGRLPTAWLWVHEVSSHDFLVFAAVRAQAGCWVQGLVQFCPVHVNAASISVTSAAYKHRPPNSHAQQSLMKSILWYLSEGGGSMHIYLIALNIAANCFRVIIAGPEAVGPARGTLEQFAELANLRACMYITMRQTMVDAQHDAFSTTASEMTTGAFT